MAHHTIFKQLFYLFFESFNSSENFKSIQWDCVFVNTQLKRDVFVELNKYIFYVNLVLGQLLETGLDDRYAELGLHSVAKVLKWNVFTVLEIPLPKLLCFIVTELDSIYIVSVGFLLSSRVWNLWSVNLIGSHNILVTLLFDLILKDEFIHAVSICRLLSILLRLSQKYLV